MRIPTFSTAIWAGPTPAPEGRAINRIRTTTVKTAGYTLLETIMVLTILMVIIGVVSVNIFGRIKQWRLSEDVGRFAQTLQMAAERAVYTNRTHVVVVNVFDGGYAIYPTDSEQNYQPGVRPLLERQRLEKCLIEEVKVEDGSSQFSGDILIYISPRGWQASVLFRIRDADYRRRHVRCDRLTTRVRYDTQPIDFIQPRQNITMYSSL